MTEIKHPILETKKIIKATVIALLIGTVILVIAVLPAEYGIDPTGLGKVMGFSKLHQNTKTEQVVEQEVVPQKSHRLLKLEDGGSDPEVERPEEANNPAPIKQLEEREDTIQVEIPPRKGVEYKINMLKYGRVKYEWLTDKGTVFFDFHGEVKQVNPSNNVYFESYTVAYSNNMIGNFLSPFEGKHGWYFKNSNESTIIVTIRLKGQYELIN
tara:strand:- start:6644 stop:7279 length:636 start_codon:yes stop_codon:yes gene_type:complete